MSSSAPRPDQHRSGPDSSPSSDSSRDPEASRRTGEATAERGFLARALSSKYLRSPTSAKPPSSVFYSSSREASPAVFFQELGVGLFLRRGCQGWGTATYEQPYGTPTTRARAPYAQGSDEAPQRAVPVKLGGDFKALPRARLLQNTRKSYR